MNWTQACTEIEHASREAADRRFLLTAVSLTERAADLPAPDEVGLGYWRNSVRLTWAEAEVEIFENSIETYRFDPTGTSYATLPFQPGDALPVEVRDLFERDATHPDGRDGNDGGS